MQQRILDQQGINFLTLTLVDWVDLFSRPVYCDMILESLRFCQKEKDLKVHAFVIMSSHLHLILQTDNKDGLSSIIQSFKSYTAQQFLKYLKDNSSTESRRDWLLNRFEFNAKKNKTNSDYQVWYLSSSIFPLK